MSTHKKVTVPKGASTRKKAEKGAKKMVDEARLEEALALKYPVEVHFVTDEEGDGYYMALLPDFGWSVCSATGETACEAVENLDIVRVAVINHLFESGAKLPEPSKQRTITRESAKPKSAYEFAVEYARVTNAKLLATDERFRGSTVVVHREGTVFFTASSFIEMLAGPAKPREETFYEEIGMRGTGSKLFIIVYAEHHPPRVFDSEDLVLWKSPGPERTPGRVTQVR